MDQEQRRHQFHQILIDLLGSNNVYFQPPESVKIQYPCIVYSRDRVHMKYADNYRYFERQRYLVTYIDRNPDSEIPKKLRDLQGSSFDRHYTADNLYHDVYGIYY